MIRCRNLLAAALFSTSSIAAVAAGNVTLTDQNNAYVGTVGNPLVVTGGTGGGGSYTGSTATTPGTNGATATPVQGVAGGVPVGTTISGTPSVSIAFGAVGQYNTVLPTTSVGTNVYLQSDKHSQLRNTEAGSDDPLVGITPVVTQAGTSAVGKASQGNLYSAYAVNTTATAGYLVLINATAAPATSAAITPIDVAALSGAVGATATVNYGAGPPNGYSTGIVALITTSLTTYTPGGNAFVQVRAR